MDLPASWNLKTKKRKDGKLDVIGKDDTGAEYRVRTCDTGAVTEKDVAELKAADREAYPNRQAGVKSFIKDLVAHGEAKKAKEEETFYQDIMYGAEPVVHAGLEKKGSTVGTSWRYRQNYDSVFGGNS